jgi:regulator of cell morphogenesis and NO signaling
MSLAELATIHPAASRVFHRYHLDFCCGGRRPLADACRERALDPGAILAEVAEAEAAAPDLQSWADRPLVDLVSFIVNFYHARLRVELPELVALAAKVEDVHAEKPTCPLGLRAHLQAIHEAVLDHLAKEEHILFPMIVGGRTHVAGTPIRVMEHEHTEHAANLAITRQKTANLTAPAEACSTWRALYLRLGAFETELMDHIHLENNILFPRALDLD